MNLLEKLTEKSLQLSNVDYLDYTLRFEVSRNEKEKVIDLYSLDKRELEWLLDIKHIGNRDTNNLRNKVCNDWYEVVSLIEHVRSNNNMYTMSNVIGYEVINEHFIKVYYSHYVSNS